LDLVELLKEHGCSHMEQQRTPSEVASKFFGNYDNFPKVRCPKTQGFVYVDPAIVRTTDAGVEFVEAGRGGQKPRTCALTAERVNAAVPPAVRKEMSRDFHASENLMDAQEDMTQKLREKYGARIQMENPFFLQKGHSGDASRNSVYLRFVSCSVTDVVSNFRDDAVALFHAAMRQMLKQAITQVNEANARKAAKAKKAAKKA
jgi:monoamine oxidase